MSYLTPQQEAFSRRVAAKTGLNVNVIRAWALREESSGAAQKRAAQGNNNWLNIGYFDSGPGALTKNPDWATPESAADATAAFLKGQKYGASSGIRGILSHVGQTPAQQLGAIASSGWASSGYGGVGSLLSTFKTVSGQNPGSFPTTPTATPAASPGFTTKVIPPRADGMPTIGGPQAALDIFNRVGAKAALIQFKGLNQPTVKVIPSTSVAAGGVSPNAPAVVAEIKKYLGTKYVWGGTTPKGFDCSGLLQYVWAQKGVHIPRTTYQQVKYGTEVPLNSLKPGDAVFFGSHDSPHHVGMYIGHGQFIDAPHTGAVVRIENLNDRLGDFAQARRF